MAARDRHMRAPESRCPAGTDGASSGLSDVEPSRDIDLHDVELEDWVVARRLDHAGDAAGAHEFDHACSHLGVADFSATGTDAELIVVVTGQSMDHAERVATEIMTLW